MQTESDKLPKYFCYYAFQGFSTQPHGRARPCCINVMKTKTYMNHVDVEKYPNNYASEVIKTNTIEEFINDPAIMQLRKDMLENKKPSSCERCWKLEDVGIKSFRQIQNEIYKDNIDTSLKYIDNLGYSKKQAITYLDISLGNICNLKCRSCNPWNSHRWLEEGDVLPHHRYNDYDRTTCDLSSNNPWFVEAFKNNYFDDVLPNVTAINFLGGEPLVVKEHYDWLEHIVEQGWATNISLFYNSNGTTIPKRILDIWKNFKSVNLALSLDAVGDLAYYVRYPSDWKMIEKNVKKLQEYSKTYKNFFVQTHATLSCLNIHAIEELFDWCIEQYKTWHFVDEETWKHNGYQNALPHINIVEEPSFMHIRHLPDVVKNHIITDLDRLYQKYSNNSIIPEWEKHSIENLRSLQNLLKEQRDPKEWQKFIDVTNVSDRFRNVDIKSYITWMENYI
jgi:hypothetical protein